MNANPSETRRPVRNRTMITGLVVVLLTTGLAAVAPSASAEVCTNKPEVCIVITNVAFLTNVFTVLPDLTPTPPPLATLTIESAALTVNESSTGEFVSLDVVTARLNSVPNYGAALNRCHSLPDESSSVCYSYAVEDTTVVPVDTGITGGPQLGELWTARLQVFVGGNEKANVPFVNFVASGGCGGAC